MSIFIIRHGETASNAAGVVQTPDVPLSERGLAQAELLARRMARDGVARILTSDHSRALMTAERIQAATDAPLEVDELLRERDFGEIRGRPYAELGNIMAPDYEPPGGESWEAFHARVVRTWSLVREAAGRTRGNLAVVTHGLVCFSLLHHHLTLGELPPPDLRFGNTGVTIVDHEEPYTVHKIGCIEHLDEASADDEGAISGI
jgi:probable phosphoglycerate mutase